MFDAETLGDEPFLSSHHIFVAIPGKPIMQPIIGLTRTAKPDRIWQDEELRNSKWKCSNISRGNLE